MARIIRRYENRKLYDTEASGYVSLQDIATLVREGHTVQILDQATGDDLTAQTLAQVILDEGRRGRSPLSSEAMHELLRRGGEALGSGVATIRTGVDDLLNQSVGKVQAFLKRPTPEEVANLSAQLRRLETLLGRMVSEADNHDNNQSAPGGASGEHDDGN